MNGYILLVLTTLHVYRQAHRNRTGAYGVPCALLRWARIPLEEGGMGMKGLINYTFGEWQLIHIDLLTYVIALGVIHFDWRAQVQFILRRRVQGW